MLDWKFFVLERPEPGPCEEPLCESREADILCDLCNKQCCKRHSYDWSYPTARGYDHPAQKIICVDCANSLRDGENNYDDTGQRDSDPGRLRRRDGIAWEALRF